MTAPHPAYRATACASPPLGWLGIARLGVVQSAIGATAMLATSLLNRAMVVEYAVPAALPAGLFGALGLDVRRAPVGSRPQAFMIVYTVQALLLPVAASFALRGSLHRAQSRPALA